MIRNAIAAMPAAEYGTTGLADWITNNIISIILLGIACAVLFAGLKGNIPKAVTILGGLVLGLFALGLAVVPGAAEGFGEWALGLIRN